MEINIFWAENVLVIRLTSWPYLSALLFLWSVSNKAKSKYRGSSRSFDLQAIAKPSKPSLFLNANPGLPPLESPFQDLQFKKDF